jgi:hypothetical protein
MALVVVESSVGYQSNDVEYLTSYRDPVMGQWQSGSLTGAVAS